MKSLVFEARRVLERLSDMLTDNQEAASKQIRGLSNYEDAAWSHKVADHIGYQRALDEVKALLTIKDREE